MIRFDLQNEYKIMKGRKLHEHYMNNFENEKNERFKMCLDSFIENLDSKYNLSTDEYATLCEINYNIFYLKNLIKAIREYINDDEYFTKINAEIDTLSKKLIKEQKYLIDFDINNDTWYEFIFKDKKND